MLPCLFCRRMVSAKGRGVLTTVSATEWCGVYGDSTFKEWRKANGIERKAHKTNENNAKKLSVSIWDVEVGCSSHLTRTKIPLKSLISEGFFLFFGYCGAGFEGFTRVVRAVQNEPGISLLESINRTSTLLESSLINALYEDFGVLKEIIGDPQIDLVVPASLWIDYLSVQKQ